MVLGLAGVQLQIMSPEHYFNDKSAILLHPGTLWNENLHHKACADPESFVRGGSNFDNVFFKA